MAEYEGIFDGIEGFVNGIEGFFVDIGADKGNTLKDNLFGDKSLTPEELARQQKSYQEELARQQSVDKSLTPEELARQQKAYQDALRKFPDANKKNFYGLPFVDKLFAPKRNVRAEQQAKENYVASTGESKYREYSPKQTETPLTAQQQAVSPDTGRVQTPK